MVSFEVFGIWVYDGIMVYIHGIQSSETGVLGWLNGKRLSSRTKLAVSAGGPEHAKSMFPTWRSFDVDAGRIKWYSNIHLPDLVCIVLETDDRIGCLETWAVRVTGCELSCCSIWTDISMFYVKKQSSFLRPKSRNVWLGCCGSGWCLAWPSAARITKSLPVRPNLGGTETAKKMPQRLIEVLRSAHCFGSHGFQAPEANRCKQMTLNLSQHLVLKRLEPKTADLSGGQMKSKRGCSNCTLLWALSASQTASHPNNFDLIQFSWLVCFESARKHTTNF